MLVCCFFFFFKQKTAYEMRISDWSSDVCSSDLAQLPEAATLDRTEEVIRRMTDIMLEEPGVAHSVALPGLSVNGFVNAPNVDRKSVVEGKSVSVRVDLGGRSIIKKTN